MKSFFRGGYSQSAGRKANNTINAMHQALCAFPLAAGGIKPFLFKHEPVIPVIDVHRGLRQQFPF
jgi:hypothetical protein